MFYLIILVVGLAMAGGLYWKVEHDGYVKGMASCKQDLAEAQEKAKQEGEKRKAEAAVKIQDMQSAFEAGEAKSKLRGSQQLSKAIQNATTSPALRNADCTLDSASLLDIQSARSGLRSSTDSAKSP